MPLIKNVTFEIPVNQGDIASQYIILLYNEVSGKADKSCSVIYKFSSDNVWTLMSDSSLTLSSDPEIIDSMLTFSINYNSVVVPKKAAIISKPDS